MRRDTNDYQIPAWAWIVAFLLGVGVLLTVSSSPSSTNYEEDRDPGACQAAGAIWPEC
jgi:hypothetical protein